MTRYSRSVIPGRPPGEPLSHELETVVFGKKGRPANDDDDDDLDEDEADNFVRRANTDRRSKADRRSAKGRRQVDFAPLPGEGPKFRHEGSMRGPILLAGAAVIVAVFGVVVWNAYREGVRSQDANTAPQLAAAGAFKSKPEIVAPESSSAAEASVFEQVEAPKPSVEPAPEVREAPAPPTAAVVSPPQALAPSISKPAEPSATAAPAKSAPAKPVATKPPVQSIETQSPKTQPKAATPPAPVAAPVQTAAAPKEEAISLIGGPRFTPAFAPGGKYVVQIAAAASEAGANAEWAKRVKAMPELFPGAAEKIIVQADVDGRTVYRVRVGAFVSAADADGFCSAIKAKGGACFRTAR